MIRLPFNLKPKTFVGIDVGTAYIKIVEVGKAGPRKKLENYGSLSAQVLYEKPFRTFEKSSLLLSSHDIARAITAVLKEAKILSRQVIFSIPDFSTFFTNIEFPPMSEEELSQAVQYEARQHIPLPLGEVTLDWQLIEGKPGNKSRLKVLLVAVPNEVINQYQEIARISQLNLFALEAEAFGLIRSLVKADDRETIAIIDIGAQSTTCNIVDKKVLNVSHSFDMGGNEFTKIISNGLSVPLEKAEIFKQTYGINDESSAEAKDTKEILSPLVDIILRETDRIISNYSSNKVKPGNPSEIAKIILAGGAAYLPGLKEYFSNHSGRPVEIANPFQDIFYPPLLENSIKKMGPSYAVAVGVALRGLE